MEILDVNILFFLILNILLILGMVNGAGLAMATMDLLKIYNG